MAASPPDVANDLQTLLQNSDGTVLNRLAQSGGEFDLFLAATLQKNNNGGTSTAGGTVTDWQSTGNLMCSALTRIEADLALRINTETDTDHQDTELEVGLLARLEQVLDLCTYTLREKTCSLEVLHALSQVFDPGASFNKDETWASDSYSKPKGSLLAQLINFFGSCDGFELVRQRLRNARDLPIAHLAALLRPFGQCYQQLSSDTVMRYFMPTVDLVCSHLLSCSDRQLFQQDVPPGELPANLTGQRAAYVIVESVMNLLSVVKSEDVDAEVKVQYWQETILTRLKRALEEETSPQTSSPTDSSTQQGNGHLSSSSPPTWMSPPGTEPRSSNDWSSGSESEPVSHSSRSCQTMPCVVDSIPPETLDLIDRLTKDKDSINQYKTSSDQESCSSNTGSGGSTGGGCTPTGDSITPPLPIPELLAAIKVEEAMEACFPSTSYAADPLGCIDIRTPLDLLPQEVIIKTATRREVTPVGSIDSRTLQGPAVYMGAGTMPTMADSSDSSSLVSTVPSVPRSASELGNTCRVCFEGEMTSKNRLIRPCRCSGSAASIHRQCLVKWIHISGNRRCEVCNARFSYVPFSERMRGFMDKFRQNRRWRNAAFAVLVGLVVILYLIIFAVFPGGIMNV